MFIFRRMQLNKRGGYALALLVILLGLSMKGQPLAAQQLPTAAYWLYDARGRVDLIEVADVNHDGVDEFIVVAEDSNLTLLRSDGVPEWEPVQTADKILQLALVNVDGADEPQLEVMVGTRSQLLLLDSDGQPLWQLALDTAAAPTDASDALLAGPPLFDIAPLDGGDNEGQDVLVALRSGELWLLDGRTGDRIWRYQGSEPSTPNPQTRVQVADFDNDGLSEVAYSYFTARGFGVIEMLNEMGGLIWRRSISGRATQVVAADFTSVAGRGESATAEPLSLAVGTNRGAVYLFDGKTGRERWFRTPNRAVSSLAMAKVGESPALIVGTEVGTVLAYDVRGRRLWDRTFATGANRAVTRISTTAEALTPEIDFETNEPLESKEQPTGLAVMLAPLGGRQARAAELLLLDGQGLLLATYPSVSPNGVSRLTDVNRDGNSELLLATFGTLSLLDPELGTDTRRYGSEWTYRLEARPQTLLVADLDDDGQADVLVGGSDGRIHLIDEVQGTARWTVELGGVINHLAAARLPDGRMGLVVVRNEIITGEDGAERAEGVVEILLADGGRFWQSPLRLPSAVTSLLLTDIWGQVDEELVVGTKDGGVATYTLAGVALWRAAVGSGVTHLLADKDEAGNGRLIVATEADQIYWVDNSGQSRQRAGYVADIVALLPLTAGGEAHLIVITRDGQIRALNSDGVPLPDWRGSLETQPLLAEMMNNGLLVVTEAPSLLRLSTSIRTPLEPLWSLGSAAGFGRISSLFSGDLNNDGQPDIAVGDQAGRIWLYAGDGRVWGDVALTSRVVQLGAVAHTVVQAAAMDLIAVTDNGVVHRLSVQANRPPLLTNPRAEVSDGRYTVSVAVTDVDRDEVSVTLYVLGAEGEQWEAAGTRTVRGSGTLFWSVASPVAERPLRYRLAFDDGSHQGQIEPTAGPIAAVPTNWLESNWLVALAFGVAVGIALLLVQQTAPYFWRAWLLYGRMRRQPARALVILSAGYRFTAGSPDFLLALANRARQNGDQLLASLADGLFLLPDRPETGVAIVNHALKEAQKRELHESEIWQMAFQTTQTLLEAPSVSELGMLRPHLAHLVKTRQEAERLSEAFADLLAPLTSIRDSGRVVRMDDRLVYLHEATVLLRQQQDMVAEQPTTIQNALVLALIKRWRGLLNAAMSDLRGRAWLVPKLKTQRIFPDQEAVIALEVENTGRAAAEEIVAVLQDDPSYEIVAGVDTVAVIAPGRRQLVSFTLRPRVEDQFRVALSISFLDPNHVPHTFEFADRVHLLPPERGFEPILNPYAPGTPLRSTSQLFFGRQNLLNDIIENASRTDQQNVLILVGQRRTGKTSALLRLEQYAPETLLPVYIDCQSLGVMPGMAAFLHDLAWFIADALAARGYSLDVPDIEHWDDDPAHFFQRQFLPAVQALLPPETMLLLVFDEFEVFENLVNDGILPSTFFPFLRHLMQHGRGLNFVFAGTHRLEEMGTDYWSVLFNIALYRQVDYLSESAARDLITQPVAPYIVYDDLALDKILRVTAGHPYFLQLVCYTLVNRANKQKSGYVTIADVNVGLQEMLRLGEAHFAYLWQQSTTAERALLTAIAHTDGNGPYYPLNLISSLQEYDFHLELPEVTRALQRLVQRGIMQEVNSEGAALYALRIGLVGLWVAENKSVGNLFESDDRRIISYD